MDIIALLQVLSQGLDETSIRRMSVIVLALLTMTGRITMLGLSRWAEKGGSYRTAPRFYNTASPWGMALWLFFATYLYQAGSEYLLVGDESVVSKAGQKTYGLDRFFSSIFGKPIAGLAFFALSLVSIDERKSYPLAVEQVTRSATDKTTAQANKAKGSKKSPKRVKKQGKPGRPAGVKNKDKRQIEWNEELRRLQGMVSTLLGQISHLILIRYLVLDGHFGNNNVLQMVRQTLSLHLISKLRHDAALYFLYDGAQSAKGRPRIYGNKLDFDHMPAQCLVKSFLEEGIQTDIYQATLFHKSFADLLNVVILVKTNRSTQHQAQVILFSSDLQLAYDKLIDAYQLRFQIEFNFRDAKQFWGFDDFMNVNQTPLTNAVGLAFFMVNFSSLLLTRFRKTLPDCAILDLKAHFRARRYALETLKLLPDFPDPILFNQILDAMPALGAIRSHHLPLPHP